MLVDPATIDCARHFLQYDAEGPQKCAHVQTLAEAIQRAVEDWFHEAAAVLVAEDDAPRRSVQS